MAEREVVIEKVNVDYGGLFDFQGLLNIIREFERDKQYIFAEQKHSEAIRPDGKDVTIKAQLMKKLTDYAQSVIVLEMHFTKLKEKVVEVKGIKKKYMNGKVNMVFDGVLRTDYEARWENKPTLYVIRGILERYVYTPYISGAKDKIASDTNFLINELKAFLNLHKSVKP